MRGGEASVVDEVVGQRHGPDPQALFRKAPHRNKSVDPRRAEDFFQLGVVLGERGGCFDVA